MCGGFNSYIIKEVQALINEEYAHANVSILSIGKKSSEFFDKNGFNIVGKHDSLFTELTFDNVAKVAESVMEQFVMGDYDKVVLVYNQFKNAATQIITSESFLPVQSNKNVLQFQ